MAKKEKPNWKNIAKELISALDSIVQINEISEAGPCAGYYGEVCKTALQGRGLKETKGGAKQAWEILKEIDGLDELHGRKGSVVDKIAAYTSIHKNFQLNHRGTFTTT